MAANFIDHQAEVLRALLDAEERALEKCGLFAEGAAKGNLTKNKSVDTGALRNSVTHEVDLHSKQAVVGSNLRYAPYVELGTGQYAPGGRDTPWVYKDGKGNWHTTRGNPAKPFLQPAVAKNAKTYSQIIKDELKD